MEGSSHVGKVDFKRAVILAEGSFGLFTSKTAIGLVRYREKDISCIIDSTKAGKISEEIIGTGNVPVVSSVEESLEYDPDALVIGIAPPGGSLPGEWRDIIIEAMKNGMNVVSGLHTFLSDDPEIMENAKRHGVKIWDVRKPEDDMYVAHGLAGDMDSTIVLTVGTDCSVGKMTTSIEMARYAEKRGRRIKFLATGQTGIMIEGDGVPADRVISDFLAGAIEKEVLKHRDMEFIFVEGQGSIVHPAYSGVTLGILHGCAPDYMVMCHRLKRTEFKGFGGQIPPVSDQIELYERLARYLNRNSKICAISVNTWEFEDDIAREKISDLESETGLPVTDPLRYGVEKLFSEIEEF